MNAVNQPITPSMTLPEATGGIRNRPATDLYDTAANWRLDLYRNYPRLVRHADHGWHAPLRYSGVDICGQAGKTPVTPVASFTVTVVEPESTLNTVEIRAINEVFISELATTMTGQTSSAITQRIAQTRSGNGGGVTLAGQSSFAGLATTHGKAMTEGTSDMKSMLNGSGFALPLNAVGGGIGVYSPAFWGSGGYEEISGESDITDGKLDWDGDVTSFSVGVDAHLRNNLLGGVAITRNEADLEYDVANRCR